MLFQLFPLHFVISSVFAHFLLFSFFSFPLPLVSHSRPFCLTMDLPDLSAIYAIRHGMCHEDQECISFVSNERIVSSGLFHPSSLLITTRMSDQKHAKHDVQRVSDAKEYISSFMKFVSHLLGSVPGRGFHFTAGYFETPAFLTTSTD